MADAPCAGCGKVLGFGEYTEAFGKEYHVDCFVCYCCKKPFPDGAFVNVDGKAAHDECAKKHAPLPSQQQRDTTVRTQAEADTCAGCAKPIVAGSNFLKTEGNGGKASFFHQDCAKCADCGKPIGQGKFGLSQGRPVHASCMHGAQETTGAPAEFNADDPCPTCGKRIQGQRKVTSLGNFHLTCFKCYRCGLGIRVEEKYFQENGKPLCHRCQK